MVTAGEQRIALTFRVRVDFDHFLIDKARRKVDCGSVARKHFVELERLAVGKFLPGWNVFLAHDHLRKRLVSRRNGAPHRETDHHVIGWEAENLQRCFQGRSAGAERGAKVVRRCESNVPIGSGASAMIERSRAVRRAMVERYGVSAYRPNPAPITSS